LHSLSLFFVTIDASSHRPHQVIAEEHPN
jgi:hypothetical protein